MCGYSNRLGSSDDLSNEDQATNIEMTQKQSAAAASVATDAPVTEPKIIKPAVKGGRDSDRGIFIYPETPDTLPPTSSGRQGKRGAIQIDQAALEDLTDSNQDSADTTVSESFSSFKRQTIRDTAAESRNVQVAAEEHKEDRIVMRVTEASKFHSCFQVCCKGTFTILGVGATLFAGWKTHQYRHEIIQAVNHDDSVRLLHRAQSVMYAEKLIHREIRDILGQNTTDREKLQSISDFAEILSNKTLTVAEIAQNMLEEVRYIAQETDKLAPSHTSGSNLSQTVIA